MMEKKLPEGWVLTLLSQIGNIVTGNTPSKVFPEYYFEGTIPWVKPGDINRAVELFQTEEYLSPIGACKARILPVGTVMVTCIGNLGNIAISGTILATNQQINSIVITHDFIDNKYCYYWALTLKPWLQENSTATTVSMVNKSNFEKAPFLLPPLAEQKRIVAKLDTAFGHLDNIKNTWERTLQLRKRFLDSCLIKTGQLSYHKTEKLSSYLQESTKRIGKDWLGKSKVGVSAQKGIINLDTGQKASFENYKIVQPGDFVYNAMRINIGSIAQYEGDEIAITSPDYIVFRIKNHLSPKLLLGFLKSSNGLMEIGSNTKGSVRSRLYFKSLANVNYPIAPLSVQEQAEKVLTWYSGAIGKWENIIEISLNKIRQELLTKAFRGELVPQDSDDEPAAILLEKIQKEIGKLKKKGKK